MLKSESNEELEKLRGSFKDGQVLGEDTFLSDIRRFNCIELENKLTLKTRLCKKICKIMQPASTFALGNL